MPVPVDPYDFTNGTIADADQVDARFQALYDTLDPAVIGLDAANVQPGTFLRLLVPGTDFKLAFGYQALTFSGGSADTGAPTVTHGLGAVPRVWATAGEAAGGHVVAVSFAARTTTTFVLKGTVVDGSLIGASTIDCFWMAIA